MANPPPLSPPLFDPTEIQRLESEIGVAGIRRMLDVYQRDLERRLVRMDAAFAQHDYGTLAIECHALRAATAAIGLTRFAQELATLEASAKTMAEPVGGGRDGTRGEAHMRQLGLRHVWGESRPYLDTLSRTFGDLPFDLTCGVI